MKFSSAFKFGALCVVGCLLSLNSALANSYEQIKKDGVIRIATEGVYSPFSFHNEKDELMGYDVEIARAVAKKLGVKPKFIEAYGMRCLQHLTLARRTWYLTKLA